MHVLSKKVLVVFILLFGLLASCDALDSISTDPEPSPDSISLDEIIELKAEGLLVKINDENYRVFSGSETDILLTAQIPADASSRQITFKTTAGSFVRFSDSPTKTIVRAELNNEENNNRLIAQTTLLLNISDSMAVANTKVVVSATISGFSDFIELGTTTDN